MFRPLGLGTPLTIMIAACSSPEPVDNAAVANTATLSSDYAQTVRSLPQGQRDAVFLRAVRDAGQNCQEVTQATEVPATGAAPTWAVTCDRATRWVVAIGEGGIATVTPADALPKG